MCDARLQKGSNGQTFEAFEPLRSAEVRSALDAFRMARSVALFLAGLRAALSKKAMRRGMREPEARLHAEALFETLTWQEPKLATEWVPYGARAKPSHEPVRELPQITITRLDRERLSHLLKGLDAPLVRDLTLLDRELARADMVPSTSIAPDVVTMNSRGVSPAKIKGRREKHSLRVGAISGR